MNLGDFVISVSELLVLHNLCGEGGFGYDVVANKDVALHRGDAVTQGSQ